MYYNDDDDDDDYYYYYIYYGYSSESFSFKISLSASKTELKCSSFMGIWFILLLLYYNSIELVILNNTPLGYGGGYNNSYSTKLSFF
jgi:hypothetical protein